MAGLAADVVAGAHVQRPRPEQRARRAGAPAAEGAAAAAGQPAGECTWRLLWREAEGLCSLAAVAGLQASTPECSTQDNPIYCAASLIQSSLAWRG